MIQKLRNLVHYYYMPYKCWILTLNISLVYSEFCLHKIHTNNKNQSTQYCMKKLWNNKKASHIYVRCNEIQKWEFKKKILKYKNTCIAQIKMHSTEMGYYCFEYFVFIIKIKKKKKTDNESTLTKKKFWNFSYAY